MMCARWPPPIPVPATTRRMRLRDSRVRGGCVESSCSSVSTSTSVIAAGATRMAVLVPEASVSDVASGGGGGAATCIVAAPEEEQEEEEVLMKVEAAEAAEGAVYDETETEEDVDADDEVEATAAVLDPTVDRAATAVIDVVVVGVAASTRSQLGLQNLEFRWRFRLLCMCVL